MDITLNNSLAALDREHLSVFLEALVKLRGAVEDFMNDGDFDEETFDPCDGICGNYGNFVGRSWWRPEAEAIRDTAKEAKSLLFRAWPEFSGCTMYPVPGIGIASGTFEDEVYDDETEEYVLEEKPVEDYSEVDAEETFDSEGEKWEGEYGESRYRLLNFMIDTLTKFLASEPEAAPAPVTAANYKPAHGGYPGTVR